MSDGMLKLVEDESFDEAWSLLVGEGPVMFLRGETGLHAEQRATPDGTELALRALAALASRTVLRQFYPFTSMNRLCLARSASHQDLQPACVAYTRDGTYWVYSGSPYGSDARCLAERVTAEEAVEVLVRALGLD